MFIGKNSYLFWKEESSFNNAEAMGNGSSQKHIPVNKMEGFKLFVELKKIDNEAFQINQEIQKELSKKQK